MRYITVLFFGIVILNFSSCRTYKYYQLDNNYRNNDKYTDTSEYFNIWIQDHLNMKEQENYPFSIFMIEPRSDKTKSGLKKITIEEMSINANNITYDMRVYIKKIDFYGEHNYHKKVTYLEEINGIISIDITDKVFVKECYIDIGNPGIKYSKVSDLTLSINIKVELEDGTTEQIIRKYNGKRKTFSISIFLLWLAVLFGASV